MVNCMIWSAPTAGLVVAERVICWPGVEGSAVEWTVTVVGRG